MVAVGSALVRPGEVDDGNLEERIAEECQYLIFILIEVEDVPAVLKTGKGIVPSHKSSQESKESSRLLQSDLSGVVAQIMSVVLASEQKEADVEEEEEREECNSGSESADEEESCEDEPAGEEETHD